VTIDLVVDTRLQRQAEAVVIQCGCAVEQIDIGDAGVVDTGTT